MASAILPSTKKDDKLTEAEIRFLTACCVYKHEGNSLALFSPLAKYLVNAKVCKNTRLVSFYKYRLGMKKWVKVSRDVFELNDLLISPEELKTFKFVFKG